jgi:predicted dehydrogenase
MKILKTAVVGLGRAGWQMHIPEVLRHKNLELIAVVDPLEERLEEVNREFGIKGYKHCKELYDHETTDLVVIASPTHFHKDQAILAFENSSDVLCDKPMACSLDEADEMINSMESNDRKLMIYQPHRAYAYTVAILDILSKDLIGQVYMIKRAWTMYRIRVDWQAFSKYGGGELNNSGAHFIDQLIYLSGSQVKTLSCFPRKIISRGDAEDVAKIVMETENGIILDLDINFASAIPITPFQVFGNRGSIIWDEENNTWRVRYYHQEDLKEINLQNNLAADNRSYCDDQDIPWQEAVYPVADYKPIDFYEKCYEYFALNKEPFIPVSQSREIMRIVEQCRQGFDIEKSIQV